MLRTYNAFFCQSELERERIALELEEKKKTQGEWEKRLHDQAKRIENLSSMVLFSNRDESVKYTKKVLLMHVQIYLVLKYIYKYIK